MAAEKLRDLSQPIDVALLDATVAAFYGTGSKEEVTPLSLFPNYWNIRTLHLFTYIFVLLVLHCSGLFLLIFSPLFNSLLLFLFIFNISTDDATKCGNWESAWTFLGGGFVWWWPFGVCRSDCLLTKKFDFNFWLMMKIGLVKLFGDAENRCRSDPEGVAK